MTSINPVSNQAPAFKGVKKPNMQQYAEAHKFRLCEFAYGKASRCYGSNERAFS